MKKIFFTVLILLLLTVFLPTNGYCGTTGEPGFMITLTKGKLKEFVQYVLNTRTYDMRKFVKKRSLKKQLKKKKFPIDMDMPGDEEIEHMAEFIMSISGYREYTSLCQIRIEQGKIKFKSGSDRDETVARAAKYKMKSTKYEGEGLLRSVAKEVYQVENTWNSAFLVYYDTCMVHKARAILRLVRLMQSSNEYSEIEIAQMMEYGRKTLEDDFMILKPHWLINVREIRILQMKQAIKLVLQKKVQINLRLQFRPGKTEEKK